jgi:predicted SAM-dependent methyltransferase
MGRQMPRFTQRLKASEAGRRASESPTITHAWLRLQSVPFYVTHGHVRGRRIAERYVASTAEPRLQIGSGPVTHPGWLNSDLIGGDLYLDVARPLPLPDGCMAYVFGEHVIEHLPEATGRRALREMFRVLRPGGVLRLTTPDLKKIIALYEDRNPEMSRAEYVRFLDDITGRRHDRPCQLFNDFMRLWGHAWVYDEEDLTAKLQEAGFVDVARREFGSSPHAALNGLENHGPPWQNTVEAMCLEARRP